MLTIDIRAASCADATPISHLMTQLGYAVSPQETSDRITQIAKRGGETFIAEKDGVAVGCIQASIDVRLAEGCFGEIISLVVDENGRGLSVGKQLVMAASEWLLARGCERLRVRCNAVRLEALEFYGKLGFEHMKQQSILEKSIG
ncbi:GNAT family N-acetyltransferase [Hahella aquimaris]|uniref:GNAT family N-acetyltransferase n=1 Tax=Hahella sp. HNIBRBA332 TaxID=3015983 RepID=UPI00273AEB3A|nr:GNAT family N-acetyltransferase [Hahella sp. HNIBRBA332]WLQ11670.1 GNAT family N-acetyltransferase [Hahella sp. HNIBRBA332]